MNKLLVFLSLAIILVHANAFTISNEQKNMLEELLKEIEVDRQKLIENTKKPINQVICGCDVNELEKCKKGAIDEKDNINLVDTLVMDSAKTLIDFIQNVFKKQKSEQKQSKPECLNQRTTISCQNDEKIKIISSSISNKDYNKCPAKVLNKDYKICKETKNIKDLLNKKCDDKQKCEINVDVDFAGVCECMSQKYLDLTYSCVKNESNQGLERSSRAKRAFNYNLVKSKKNNYDLNGYSEDSWGLPNFEVSGRHHEAMNAYARPKKRYNYESSSKGGYKKNQNKEYNNKYSRDTYKLKKKNKYENAEYSSKQYENSEYNKKYEGTGYNKKYGGSAYNKKYEGTGYNKKYGGSAYNKKYEATEYNKKYDGSGAGVGAGFDDVVIYDDYYVAGDDYYGDYIGLGDYYGFGGFPDYYGFGDYYGLGGFGGLGYFDDYLIYGDLIMNGWGGWGPLYDYVTENYIPMKNNYAPKYYNGNEYAKPNYGYQKSNGYKGAGGYKNDYNKESIYNEIERPVYKTEYE